ncbi:MAG: YjiG family protein [Sutterella sp.]|nr:YjiG family protein [Sutterella sp.]
MATNNSKVFITDVFVKGAINGWNLITHSTIPNVLMAFVIIKILNISGLLAIIGKVFSPIMMIFGLPGEAATVLIAGWMSIGGGVGVAAALIDQGSIGVRDIAILCPAIVLMGSQVQYMGRCLGVIGTSAKRIPVLMGISIINALIAMLIMNFIV